MCKFLNHGGFNTTANKTKKLETLDTQGLQASRFDDSDWARTSDLYPVKVAKWCHNGDKTLIYSILSVFN
ncbi:hypothetical protein MGA3_04945 [Bacillus methanolicus MGA3]|nr:hypothetical protein MGA3_04945 [Bacillus methanolicus MGA3]